eukprot:364814-Chlamydomonas_euryale.AAC.17
MPLDAALRAECKPWPGACSDADPRPHAHVCATCCCSATDLPFHYEGKAAEEATAQYKEDIHTGCTKYDYTDFSVVKVKQCNIAVAMHMRPCIIFIYYIIFCHAFHALLPSGQTFNT